MLSCLSCLLCCFPSPKVSDEMAAKKQSRAIDKSIQHNATARRQEIKILLLGTGESGKSTIVKQMKIIHQNGYSKDELHGFKKDIWKNVLEGMKQMINAMQRLNIQFQTPLSINASSLVLKANVEEFPLEGFPKDLADAVHFLWNESGLKALYDKITQISYVLDSAPYFFDQIRRISGSDYIPNVQDVLKARIKTTGISETHFKMGSQGVCLIDVGGQISERKKWIHCFENVTSIIFCVALSEYDQVLLEDPTQSRMLDSFLLFQSIINSQWFHNTSIILFLNKTDIFRKKLIVSPLKRYFEDYNGGSDFEAGANYIKNKFLSLNHSKLPIYPHYTCATDTQQIETVFSAVKETILARALKDTGIL